jgi:hypothetical protein
LSSPSRREEHKAGSEEQQQPGLCFVKLLVFVKMIFREGSKENTEQTE